ncbi:hypothetical protein BJV78DRAFT_1279018 [Lactifluus subvellereus]|nr:hypothetical protein BJV78DRAFT_1279018 [Lactifluus subvellereus]
MSVSQSQSFQNTTADAPFDDARADVILRSSDGVDFRVFKIVLSLASPIFADMFSIPSPSPPSGTSRDGLPVVTLSEDSKVLDLALRRCYPIQSPELVELKDVHALLEFERKYQVDASCLPLTHYLTGTIERDPVEVGEDSGCTSCMMGDMLQHQKYLRHTIYSPIRLAPRYLWSYLHRSALLLAHHPSVEAVTTEAFVLRDIDCSPCLSARRTDMLDFSRIFAMEVRKAIEKVPLMETGGSIKAVASSSSTSGSVTATVNGSEPSQEEIA